MPEKRKTDFELRDGNNNFAAKRPRQQISYEDLDESPAVDQLEETRSGLEVDVTDVAENEDEEGANLGHGSSNTTSNKQNKRQRYNQQPRVDPIYGQRSAFPGLDDASSDELLYGPPEDGLEYLRLVRSEANSLPALFVAPKPATAQRDLKTAEETIQDQLETTKVDTTQIETDGAGYVLIDGVVIATSTSDENPKLDVEGKQDAQLSYYNLLKHRFVLLRTTLRCSPPAGAIADLDESHPITLPFHIKAARAAWTQMLYTAEPQMAQLACMDMESVLGVVRLLGTIMSKCIKDNDADQLRRIGAWAWGLLGRCRDVGELSSEEVGELRVFGRQALSLLKKLNRKKASVVEGGAAFESDQEYGDDEADGDEIMTAFESIEAADEQGIEELEAAKLRLHSRFLGEETTAEEDAERRRRNTSSPLEAVMADEPESIPTPETTRRTPPPPPRISVTGEEQSRILLDMIVTIVGEFYGQKDLLQERDIWN